MIHHKYLTPLPAVAIVVSISSGCLVMSSPDMGRKGGGGGFPELWPEKNLSSKESDIYFLLGLVNDIPKVILNLQ